MYSDMTNPSKLTTNKLFKGLDAPACLLKARAIASDAHGKLDAAKGKYLEAVGMVEGDSIFDPDGTGLVREWDLTVEDGNRMILTPTSEGIDQAVSDHNRRCGSDQVSFDITVG